MSKGQQYGDEARNITRSYRCDKNTSDLIDDVCKSTGMTASDIAYECVKRSLVDVWKETVEKQASAVKNLERALKSKAKG
jgi:hypothetical protein